MQALFEELVKALLPSLTRKEVRSVVGDALLQFCDLNDFVLASIAASSANIKAEIINTLQGKAKIPRGIESCVIRLELVPGLKDERLIYFLWEILNVRLKDGSVDEGTYNSLVLRLKAAEMEFA